ncbi:ClpP/crotonase-like domain-containing protein [Aspergillus karnatakaensis]|uniref:mitochondrial 37S ribosomal mS47 domain-containing protein n=1 Tax=Aspergillus karnatakaensis TaxID=1810916 RepID=UPI003CCCF41F
MLLRQNLPRSTPSSWISRINPASTMPLRAKLINPAFGSASKMSTTSDSQIPRELPGDEPDDVLFNSRYGVRLIELNRPKKLNSLNGSMVRKILPRLKEYEKSQLANIVMLSGAGSKALCAGGDVAALALQNEKGPEGQKASADFFGLEYKLDHVIATYSKPFVSIMDGITMGGGVGLSVHAPFRIATERTVFAMPETSIGFFPDVGGSFFLPRLDGELGTYLALTSERLTGVQALYAGIATHYFHSSVLGNLTARLSELVFDDLAPLSERLDLVNRTMAEFSTGLPTEQEQPLELVGGLRQKIDKVFKYDTIEEIVQALENEAQHADYSHWANRTLRTLWKRSPTSLKVTLRQLRLGRKWSISETFQREHQIASHFMSHPDFVEGVKALLISKPARRARWRPRTLAQVTDKQVDQFFTIPQGQQRMSLLSEGDYNQYPHEKYALPSEKEIEKFIRNNSASKSQIIEHFMIATGHKEGVKQKLSDVLSRQTINTTEGLRWRKQGEPTQ